MRKSDWLASIRQIRTPGGWAVSAGLALLLLAFGTAWGTQFKGGEAVHVREGEILDDFFAAASDVDFDAHLVGDLFAGGAAVTVGDSALIENSVMAAARRVDVGGHVLNSVRVCGQDIFIRGHVERNVMAFGQSVTIDDRGWIEKDLYLGSAEAMIRGRIGGDVGGGCGKVVIAGQIDGNVTIDADQVTVMQSAIIGGKLKYRSGHEAKIEEGAQLLGGVEKMAPRASKSSSYGLGSFFWDTWWFLAAFVAGLVLYALFKPFFTGVKQSILLASWRSLGLGFLFLVCVPVAAFIVAITLVGFWLAGLTMLGWAILLILSKVFVGLAMGDWLLSRMRGGRGVPAGVAMFVGMVILTFVTKIPYFGTLAHVMVFSLALGAFMITAYKYRTQA